MAWAIRYVGAIGGWWDSIPTKGDKPAKGRYGEWLGEKFLRKRGFSVIRRNWRSSLDRRLEIDLVCMDSEVLVFVEIRARSKGSWWMDTLP